MKVSIEEFSKLELAKQIQSIAFGICASNEKSIARAKNVVEAIKPLNGKDPRFCYTCSCNNWFTVWTLGYSDPEILRQVSEIIAEHFQYKCSQVDNFRQCECLFEGA